MDVWTRPKPIRPLLKKLSFIKNVDHWGPYLQGGVRKISESDYKAILESEDYDAGPISEKTISETVTCGLFNRHYLLRDSQLRLEVSHQLSLLRIRAFLQDVLRVSL